VWVVGSLASFICGRLPRDGCSTCGRHIIKLSQRSRGSHREDVTCFFSLQAKMHFSISGLSPRKCLSFLFTFLFLILCRWHFAILTEYLEEGAEAVRAMTRDHVLRFPGANMHCR
jgi:hypothetical protein